MIRNLGEWAGQNADALDGYVGVRLPLLAAAGIFVGIMLMLVLFLLVLCIRQRRKGQPVAELLQDTGKTGKMVETVVVGKLHEQGARSEQQDCFGVSDVSLLQTHGVLAVVADGMGGLTDGGKMSMAVVESILDSFFLYQGMYTMEQQLVMLAQKAVERVNALLAPSDLKKHGSTLVMGLIREGKFSFLSVGDSRVCLYRDGVLMQLNREHIYKNALALEAVNGEVSLQEVYSDQRAGGLTSFLGMGALQQIDFPAEPVRLLAGDKLLLMSDGVYNALDQSELTKCLDAEPEEAVEQIRTAIQEKAYVNQDNYTAVVIGCNGPDEKEAGNTDSQKE